MTLVLIFRLVLAGILGAAIGLEREFRAKEAGLRTHFLVTLGSALLMIVSQWGFQTSVGIPGLRAADAARVAAQIVSGIGFLGAGTIIMQKQSVRGLTTAAGLWVAAAIGMAVGGGLYILGCVTTILVISGLEVFQYLRNFKSKYLTLVIKTPNRETLNKMTSALSERGYIINHCTITNESNGETEALRVNLNFRVHSSGDESNLILFLHQFPDAIIEKIE